MTQAKEIVCVEWEDAMSYVNEYPEDVASYPPAIVRTYGILYQANDKHHIIIMHNGGDGCDDIMKVPSSMVRNVISLGGEGRKGVQNRKNS